MPSKFDNPETRASIAILFPEKVLLIKAFTGDEPDRYEQGQEQHKGQDLPDCAHK